MTRSSVVLAVSVVSLVGLAVAARPAPAGGKEYKVVAVKDGVTVKGVVRLDVADADKGKIEFPPLEIFKDNDKGCGDKQRPTERLEWDKDTLGVGNAIVFLKDVEAGKDWPDDMKSDDRVGTIDQKGCKYVPHTQCLRGGVQLVILNSDGADHNIHGFRTPADENSLKDTKFNFSSEPGSKKDAVDQAILEDPGLYLVKCDIHPWMSAYVFVATNPYHDVTQATARGDLKPGEFELKNVPPGDYTLVVWKEGMIEKPLSAGGKISAYTYSSNFTKEFAVRVEAGKECPVLEIKVPLQK